MNKNSVDKLISIIHSLKEDGMGAGAVAGGPTNVTNPSSGPLNIAGLPPDMPPVSKNKGNYKNNFAKGGKGSRKWWLQFLKGK